VRPDFPTVCDRNLQGVQFGSDGGLLLIREFDPVHTARDQRFEKVAPMDGSVT